MKRLPYMLALSVFLLLSACPTDDDDVAVDDDDLFDDDDTGLDDDDSGPDDDDSGPDDDDSGPDDDDSDPDDDDSAPDDDDSGPDDDDSAPDDDDSAVDDDDSAVDDDDSSAGDDDDSAAGWLLLGEVCTGDAQCASGICWDFHDYDPWCGGAVCSISCTTTQQCIDAFTTAGAADPNASGCGADSRCTVIGTGFGAFWCA